MKLRGILIALLVLVSGAAMGQSLPSKAKLLRADSIWIYQRMHFSAITPTYARPGDVYYKGDTLWIVNSNGTFSLGPGGGGSWGTIVGTLSNQTDLQSALNAKLAAADTASLSARINAKQDSSSSLTWPDTMSFLATQYDLTQLAGGTDTSSLSARINLKADSSLALYWSDTTIANTGLVTQNDLAMGLSAKQAYSDTSSWDATRTWVISQGIGGSVSSVGLSLPTQFTVTGSPVTTSGTLTAAWAATSPGYVLSRAPPLGHPPSKHDRRGLSQLYLGLHKVPSDSSTRPPRVSSDIVYWPPHIYVK